MLPITSPDHPRARGRDAQAKMKLIARIGSPPRAGTRHTNSPHLLRRVGITPACWEENSMTSSRIVFK